MPSKGGAREKGGGRGQGWAGSPATLGFELHTMAPPVVAHSCFTVPGTIFLWPPSCRRKILAAYREKKSHPVYLLRFRSKQGGGIKRGGMVCWKPDEINTGKIRGRWGWATMFIFLILLLLQDWDRCLLDPSICIWIDRFIRSRLNAGSGLFRQSGQTNGAQLVLVATSLIYRTTLPALLVAQKLLFFIVNVFQAKNIKKIPGNGVMGFLSLGFLINGGVCFTPRKTEESKTNLY